MAEPAANATEFTANKDRKQALKQIIDLYRLAASNVDSPVLIALSVDVLSTTDTTPALSGTVSSTAAAVIVIIDENAYTATNNADGTWDIADGTISALDVQAHDLTIVAYDEATAEVGLALEVGKVTITA